MAAAQEQVEVVEEEYEESGPLPISNLEVRRIWWYWIPVNLLHFF